MTFPWQNEGWREDDDEEELVNVKNIKCKHKDGWFLLTTAVPIGEETIVQVECNNLDCKKKRITKIIVEEVI